MTWLRAPTLLTLLVFLAFGFQVIGVFSDPVSHGKLPIASRDGYNYGILGWCQFTGKCSSYDVGYTLQGDTSSKWSDSDQKILSSIMIVHIISAGMLLIGLFMAIFTHLRNRGYWIAVEIWLVLCFLGATLSFIVEIVLFGRNLKFAGWFSLPGAILSLVSVIATAVMLHHLSNRPSKSPYSSMQDAPGIFEVGNGFHNDRDDDNLLKPDVQISTHELPPLPSSRGPVLKKTTVFHGYKKVPDGEDSSLKSVNAQKAYLPVSPSSDSIGAQPGTFPGQRPGATQPGIQGRQAIIPDRSGIQPQSQRQSPDHQLQQEQQEQQQQLLQQQQEQQEQQEQQPRQQPRQQSQPIRPPSSTSVASTEISRVPAGVYVRGVEHPEQYGPNVVKIPNVREPESAVIDYQTDETQSLSPLKEQRIPNFSRMSAQGRSYNVDPMLERNVQAGSAKPVDAAEGAQNNSLYNPNPPSFKSSATNPSLIHQQQTQQQVPQQHVQQQEQYQIQQQAQQIQRQAQQPQTYMHAQSQSIQRPLQQQPYMETPASSNLPVMQNPTYGYAYQGGYGNYQQPNYQPANYGYTPVYNYQNSYQGYNQAYVNPGPAPRPAKPQQQRSEFALDTNPDFAINDMSRRRRPNRRI